ANASTQRDASPIWAAKTIPAKRRRFFVHWRGRNATNAALSRERGRGSSTTGATSGSTIRSLVARGRENELEAAAAARLRVELDRAAESDRELVSNRQSKPGARIVARPERPEDALLL